MLTIRPYTSEDVEPVTRLHIAQGLPYPLPDWNKPEFLVRTVLEDGKGPEMALFLRKTAETFLLFDPSRNSKREILGRMLAIGKECEAAAARAGLTDVHAFIPPALPEKFTKLLVHMGWQPDWPCYSRTING